MSAISGLLFLVRNSFFHCVPFLKCFWSLVCLFSMMPCIALVFIQNYIFVGARWLRPSDVNLLATVHKLRRIFAHNSQVFIVLLENFMTTSAREKMRRIKEKEEEALRRRVSFPFPLLNRTLCMCIMCPDSCFLTCAVFSWSFLLLREVHAGSFETGCKESASTIAPKPMPLL